MSTLVKTVAIALVGPVAIYFWCWQAVKMKSRSWSTKQLRVASLVVSKMRVAAAPSLKRRRNNETSHEGRSPVGGHVSPRLGYLELNANITGKHANRPSQ